MRRSATLLVAAVVATAGLAAGAGTAAAEDAPAGQRVKVIDGGLSVQTVAAEPGQGARFVPLPPSRVLDTRNGTGRPGTAPIGQGQTVSLPLADAVPADAVAVMLNVTGTGGTGSTYVTVYPTGIGKPTVSNLNLVRGETRSNAVMSVIGDDRSIRLYNNFGTVHLIADLAGYFTQATENPAGSAPGAYTAERPFRVLDTRTSGGKVGPRQTRVVDFSGRVPEGTTSVTLNLTGVDATLPTYVTAWPSGVSRPTASSLNLAPSAATPNSVTVALGPDRKLNLYNNGGHTNLIVDLAGYYHPTAGKLFYPVLPGRHYDSRVEGDYWGPRWTYDFYFPSEDLHITALMLNLTGISKTGSTYIAAYPAGSTRPTSSVLNLVNRQVAPNMATVGLGKAHDPIEGQSYPGISVYNNAGEVDVLIDIFGYYAD